MLIASPRHTAADLRLWSELEYADRLHGQSQSLARKVRGSVDVLLEFVRLGSCYLSVSWGKDSVVMAHLAWSLFSESTPFAFWHARPERMPETEIVERSFMDRWPLLRYERIECDGDWAVREYERRSGTSRYVTGVRADESGTRRLSAAIHGHATESACRPLLHWTSRDVFGYLVANDLPVHPAYAMLGGGRWDRDRLRVEVLGGQEGRNFGRAEWEAEYYGDELRRAVS